MKKLFQLFVWIIVPMSVLSTSCSVIECCSKTKKTKKEMNSTCNHCGNTTCDMNCSANEKELKDSVKSIKSCSLNSKEQLDRFAEIKRELFSKSIRTKELKDGIEFTFQESDMFTKSLLEFIEFERGCCKDFTFALHFEPRNGPVRLRMTGSSEIKEMIKE